MDSDRTEHLQLVAQIVSAYVGRNHVSSAGLIDLIQSVSQSVEKLTAPEEPPKPEPVPAVPIRKSITPDFIISLEDGRKMKSMKRYLAARGMTPAQYRAKWGLPPDYPMVAPNYAASRSEAARKIGLGRPRQGTQPKQQSASRRGGNSQPG